MLPPTPLEAGSLLAPPHIILDPAPDASSTNDNTTPQPTSTEGADGKRASQIVYATGFVNRLISPALSDPRAWKAFRMEIRGTKLVAYKPPSDRAAGIRDLFAVGLVEDVDKEDEETLHVEDAGGGQRRDAGGMGRKKRAYWGRAQHPALCVASAGTFALGGVVSGAEGKTVPRGQVEKGSVDALLHELVFATVFLPAGAPPDKATHREEQWRDYALAVLLCLPLLVGRPRVETEFVRCAGYLVSGAQEEELEAQRARVAWLAGEYIRLHGEPVDSSSWEDFRAQTIPDATFPATQPVTSGMPSSASTQAMYAPSPALGATPFSPRPDGAARIVGLLDALGVHELIAPGAALSSTRSPQPPRSGLSSRMPWAALETEGLTRGVLLALDPHVVARSLTFFHRAVLEQAPDNLTAAFVDPSASDVCGPLFGSDASPHWLTKLLLVQIFADANSATAMHGGPTPGGEQQPSSRTHSRSELISRWVRVGELCRTAGDECTWRGICAALCSAPVARLDKVWRRVDAQALAAVEGWARLEGEAAEAKEPRTTPWGGDIRQRLKEEVDAARASDSGAAEETLLVAPMERARDTFEGFRQQFLLCPRRVTLAEDEVGEDVKLLVNYWREKFMEGGGSGGLAAKFVRWARVILSDYLLILSLASINSCPSRSPRNRAERAYSRRIFGRGHLRRRHIHPSSPSSSQKSSRPRHSLIAPSCSAGVSTVIQTRDCCIYHISKSAGTSAASRV